MPIVRASGNIHTVLKVILHFVLDGELNSASYCQMGCCIVANRIRYPQPTQLYPYIFNIYIQYGCNFVCVYSISHADIVSHICIHLPVEISLTTNAHLKCNIIVLLFSRYTALVVKVIVIDGGIGVFLCTTTG